METMNAPKSVDYVEHAKRVRRWTMNKDGEKNARRSEKKTKERNRNRSLWRGKVFVLTSVWFFLCTFALALVYLSFIVLCGCSIMLQLCDEQGWGCERTFCFYVRMCADWRLSTSRSQMATKREQNMSGEKNVSNWLTRRRHPWFGTPHPHSPSSCNEKSSLFLCWAQ